MMNVFQFGVKSRFVDAVEAQWRDEVIAPFASRVERSAR